MIKFNVAVSTICFITSLSIGCFALAGELDGKRAICNFSQDATWKDIELFLSFEGARVVVRQINEVQRPNEEFNFDYTEVTMGREVQKVYVYPSFVFWSKLIDSNGKHKDIKSYSELDAALVAGVTGSWGYVNRMDLSAERGIILSGDPLPAHSGNCQLSDEAGEVAFNKKFEELKRVADADFNKKLEEAKSVAPKL